MMKIFWLLDITGEEKNDVYTYFKNVCLCIGGSGNWTEGFAYPRQAEL